MMDGTIIDVPLARSRISYVSIVLREASGEEKCKNVELKGGVKEKYGK